MSSKNEQLNSGGKVLVLYDSASGNTAAMAQLVAEGSKAVAGIEVRVLSIDEATAEDVVWCDGIAVGSPTNMGLMSWKMKRFWDETMLEKWMKIDGKIGCAFSSAGGWGGGSEIACQSILSVLINFGFLVFGVTDYVSKLTTLHYGTITAREPRSEEAKDACRKLGKRLAEWVAVYCVGNKSEHPLEKDDVRLFPS
jgi:NAD(P)H dehydrogenase (quinone)